MYFPRTELFWSLTFWQQMSRLRFSWSWSAAYITQCRTSVHFWSSAILKRDRKRRSSIPDIAPQDKNKFFWRWTLVFHNSIWMLGKIEHFLYWRLSFSMNLPKYLCAVVLCDDWSQALSQEKKTKGRRWSGTLLRYFWNEKKVAVPTIRQALVCWVVVRTSLLSICYYFHQISVTRIQKKIEIKNFKTNSL